MKTLALVATALLLSACGGGGDDTPTVDTSGVPTCTDVWVAGETLPNDYDGCLEPDGAWGATISYECDDGSRLTAYGERWYAVFGGEIHDDDGYERAFQVCKP